MIGRRLIRQAIKAEQESIDQRKHDAEVNEALDAAELALDEYYNGDREFAEKWLLKAVEANRQTEKRK